jgi:hypothetical protein
MPPKRKRTSAATETAETSLKSGTGAISTPVDTPPSKRAAGRQTRSSSIASKTNGASMVGGPRRTRYANSVLSELQHYFHTYYDIGIQLILSLSCFAVLRHGSDMYTFTS